MGGFKWPPASSAGNNAGGWPTPFSLPEKSLSSGCSFFPGEGKKNRKKGQPDLCDFRNWTVDGGDSLDQTRFRMLQAAAGANNLGNSDHGAIVGELPVKSSMEEQAH